MNFVDRIKDSTTTTGTGAITTAGAAIGFQALTAIGAVGSTFKYGISSANGSEWEIGLGTLTAANSFSRSVISSSNGNALVNFSAGTKDVYLTLDAASVKKYDNGTSIRVVFLSNYCVSDTTLLPYAQVAGVDQRAKIQAVLDMAATAPLRIVWDVKVTVANVPDSSGDTLRVRSNTEIMVLPGCGALQAAGSSGWMLMNYNPTTNANNNFAAITDENITIDGGIWHGNREGQNNVKMDVFHFSGVRNLKTRNYTIYRASGMAFRLLNTDGHINENYTIDQGTDLITATGSTPVNTDGMHYHGPARRLRDRNGTILNCGDDSYALNADDAWGAGTFTGRFDNVYGPITDVRVDNMTINAVVFGIRLLSGGSRIDDIRITNVTGSTTAYGLVLDNYLTPSQCVLAGPGNFGSIEVDGWHMTNAVHNPAFDWGAMAIHVNAKIEQFSIKSYTKSDFNNVIFPALRIGEKANIDQLRVDYTSRNYNSGTYQTEQIDIAPGAIITQADIRTTVYAQSTVSGYPIRLQSGATIKQLLLNGIVTNFTSLLNKLGTVTSLHDGSFSDTPTATASTYVLQSGSPWVEDTSNPGKLTLSTNHSGVVDSARKIVSDAFGGNVKMTGTVRFNGTLVASSLHAAFILRGTNTVPWSGVTQGYAFDMFVENGGGLKLFKIAGGSQPTIGSTMVVPFGANIDYAITFIVKTVSGTTTISVQIQRLSDNLYLQSNATWASTVSNAITATDTTIPAASGEIAVYAFNDNAPAISTNFTNLTIVAAP